MADVLGWQTVPEDRSDDPLNTVDRARIRAEPGYRERMETYSVAYELARTRPAFAVLAGDDLEEYRFAERALDESISVVADLTARIERLSDDIAQWNIAAAGRNQVIAKQNARNWAAMRELGMTRVDGR